jgi:hypothetical protein
MLMGRFLPILKIFLRFSDRLQSCICDVLSVNLLVDSGLHVVVKFMYLNNASVRTQLAMLGLKQKAHHLGFMKHYLVEQHVELLMLCQKRPKL